MGQWTWSASAPVRRQTITGTNADLLSFGPLEANLSEIRIQENTF